VTGATDPRRGRQVTAGTPPYGPVPELDPDETRRGFEGHLLLAIEVAREARAGQ
jgi:hypothetical protein